MNGAIKLHTLLDYDGCLPVCVNLTDGKVNDAKAAKGIILPADSVVVADRAYVDFENLYRWHTGKSFFVVRLKTSVKFNRLNEKELPDNRHQHILVDGYIELSEEKTKAKYPKKLRRVVLWDEVNQQTIELITNQFSWTAMITILVLRYLKACAKYGWCLSNLLAFLRINLLVKFDLRRLLDNPFEQPPVPIPIPDVQGKLFDWGD